MGENEELWERQGFVGGNGKMWDRMRKCGRDRTVEVNGEMWEE